MPKAQPVWCMCSPKGTLSNWSKVIGFESALKVIFQFGDEPNVAPGDEDIVNVDEKYNCVVVDVRKVEVKVCLGLNELPGEESGMEPCVPGAWALTKYIQGLVELAD